MWRNLSTAWGGEKNMRFAWAVGVAVTGNMQPTRCTTSLPHFKGWWITVAHVLVWHLLLCVMVPRYRVARTRRVMLAVFWNGETRQEHVQR